MTDILKILMLLFTALGKICEGVMKLFACFDELFACFDEA